MLNADLRVITFSMILDLVKFKYEHNNRTLPLNKEIPFFKHSLQQPDAPTSQNGQAQSNNSSPKADKLLEFV